MFPGGPMRAIARNLGWLLASRGVLAVLSLVLSGHRHADAGRVGFGRFALITGAAQALATLVALPDLADHRPVRHARIWLPATTTRLAPRCSRRAALLDVASAVIGAVLAVADPASGARRWAIGPTLHARDADVRDRRSCVTIRSTPLGILRLRDRFSLSRGGGQRDAGRCGSSARSGRGGVHPTVQGFLLRLGAGGDR